MKNTPQKSKHMSGRRRRRQTTALAPFSPGQPGVVFPLEVFIGKLTTTVTTGVIASSTVIAASLVSNFASRFVAFDEYRIRKFEAIYQLCSSTNPGILNTWCEPLTSNTGAPVANDAKNNRTVTFSASATDKTIRLPYNPRDDNVTIWNAISTTTTSCGNLKVYTNNADFGSSIVATDYVVVTGIIWIEFRGWA